MVKINGKEENAAGKTLEAYLQEAAYPMARIAVERNGEIVPKACLLYTSKSLYGKTIPVVDRTDLDPVACIETGDWVRVDGEKGTVEILKKKV